MDKPSVTVLVPVYNVEKYLEHCLNSLAAQTYDSISFVCINDGSTDASPQILANYSRADSRFKVISKENSGYGASMNIGLDMCESDYVGIVEPDDFADSHMFERLVALAENAGADMVKSNYYEHHTGDDPQSDCLVENLGQGLPFGEPYSVADDRRVLWSAASIWSGLYRRAFLVEEGIRFLETPGASFQDTSFNLKALMAAKKVALASQGYLHYRIDNSGSSVKSPSKVFPICEEYAEVWRFLGPEGTERYDSFATAIANIQFKGYCWNQWRLARRYCEQFFDRFLDEFRQLEARGLLDKACWSDYDWNDLTQLLEEPDAFFARVCGARGIRKTVIVFAGLATSDAELRAFVATVDDDEEIAVYAPGNQSLVESVCQLEKEDLRVRLLPEVSGSGLMELSSMRGDVIRVATLEGTKRSRCLAGLFRRDCA